MLYFVDEILEIDEAIFKASDVKDASGLTYRQLNDWEERGVLPESKDRGSKWRKYNLHDLFIITVLAQLKSQFNTPTEKLKFIKDRMTKEGISRLNALMVHLTLADVSEWLLTDFEETYLIDSELKIKEMFSRGYFHSEEHVAYVLLNVTPLIQNVVKVLTKQKFPLGDSYIKSVQAIEASEAEVLKHIRSKDIEKVEILMADGTIKTVKVTQRRDVETQIKKMLAENAYQTITITQRDGEIVALKQTSTHKGRKKN